MILQVWVTKDTKGSQSWGIPEHGCFVGDFTERFFRSQGKIVARVPFLKMATLLKQIRFILSETAGIHPAAPRGKAILFGQMDREARLELPAWIVRNAESSYARAFGPWRARLQLLKDAVKEADQEKGKHEADRFDDRFVAAANGYPTDIVRQYIESLNILLIFSAKRRGKSCFEQCHFYQLPTDWSLDIQS